MQINCQQTNCPRKLDPSIIKCKGRIVGWSPISLFFSRHVQIFFSITDIVHSPTSLAWGVNPRLIQIDTGSNILVYPSSTLDSPVRFFSGFDKIDFANGVIVPVDGITTMSSTEYFVGRSFSNKLVPQSIL